MDSVDWDVLHCIDALMLKSNGSYGYTPVGRTAAQKAVMENHKQARGREGAGAKREGGGRAGGGWGGNFKAPRLQGDVLFNLTAPSAIATLMSMCS